MNESGMLPSDWDDEPLGKLADVIDPHPSHRAPPEVVNGVPFAGIGDFDIRGEIQRSSVRRVDPSVLAEHSSRYVLSPNSIGFGRVASIGKVIDFRRADPGVAVSPTMAVLEPRSIPKQYLVAALQGCVVSNRIARLLTGTTRSSLGIELLRSLAVPVPKDRRVARKIGDILSTADGVIEQTEALIAKTQQIKAGLMHDLFTRGVTPDGQLRPPREEAPQLYKESPLGCIPKEWAPDSFGARVEVIDPNPSHRYPEEQDEGVPICSTENFSDEDGFDFAKSKLMPPEVLDSQTLRCRFDPDDVVFARKGRIGLARRYGFEAKVFSHTVVLFKARQKCTNQQWLLWLTRSHWFLEDINRRMNSNSGVPTLGVGFINDVTVPFPEPEEQEALNRKLDGISQRIAVEKAGLAKLRKLKSGMMSDLLTGRVPVGLREAADV